MGSKSESNPGTYTKYETYWWHRPHYSEYKKDMKMDLPWEWAKEEAKLPEYQMYPRKNPLMKHDERRYNWYWYFDTPDNADCHKKIAFVTQYAVGAASIYAMYDTIFLSQPQTTGRFLTVAARSILPFAGAAALGAAVQCGVASFRDNKDDMLSFLAGGAAIGLFYGMKLGSSGRGAHIGVICMILGAITKELNRHRTSFCPRMPFETRRVQGQWGGQFGGDLLGSWRYHDPGGRRSY